MELDELRKPGVKSVLLSMNAEDMTTYTKTNSTHGNHSKDVQPSDLEPLSE